MRKKRVKKDSAHFHSIFCTAGKKSYSKSAIIIVQVRLVMAKVIYPKYYKNSNEYFALFSADWVIRATILSTENHCNFGKVSHF